MMAPHNHLSELPNELLKSRHATPGSTHIVRNECASANRRSAPPQCESPYQLHQGGLEFSAPRQTHRNSHGRHESLPVITTSFSSPIRASQHPYRDRRQRGSSDFSVLSLLKHNHSPLEELIHQARARLHSMGISETRTRDQGGETGILEAPFEMPSFIGPLSSPMLGTPNLPSSPPFSAPTSRRPNDHLLEDVEEEMMHGIRQRLAFRPGASLTRHRSRTPIWQSGSAAVATEDIVRSGQLRRARPGMEQENEEDMMMRFAEQRRVFVERHAHGGILERTPPREGYLERRNIEWT